MYNKDKYIKKIRKFDRFYTVLTGSLDAGCHGNGYSATESEVLLEINSGKKCTAKSLSERLNIDKGYMSRIIKSFENRDLIVKEPSDIDRRTQIIRLTPKGKSEAKSLIYSANLHISELIKDLDEYECKRVCKAMEQIIEVFAKD